MSANDNSNPIPLFLGQLPNMKKKWDENDKNLISYDYFVNQIKAHSIDVYFQKFTNNNNGAPRQKIFIPIDDNMAIVLITSKCIINKDDNTYYSLSIEKFWQLGNFYIPQTDTIAKRCKINFVGPKKGTNNADFINLIRDIETLQIPVKIGKEKERQIKIDKEKDKQIWTNYVDALKKLIRQKEQIWKIQKVGKRYEQIDQFTGENVSFVDIFIDEDDLTRQFESELCDYLEDDNIAYSSFSNEKAQVKFNCVKEFYDEELLEIQEMSTKYFYEMSDDSPIHFVSGMLLFKNGDNDVNSYIEKQIESALNEEYGVKLDIDKTGTIHNNEEEVRIIDEILNQKFNHVAKLIKDDKIHHKVRFGFDSSLLPKIQNVCKEKNIFKEKIYIKDSAVVIEVKTFLGDDFLTQLGFKKTAHINRYGPKTPQSQYAYIENSNCTKDGIYEFSNIKSKKDSDDILCHIRKINNNKGYHQLATRYIFEYDSDAAHDFKTNVDIENKVCYNIDKSDLIITPENENEYLALVNDIKRRFPEVWIESSSYSKSYKIEYRNITPKNIVNIINNHLKDNNLGPIQYDLNKPQQVLFTYQFSDTLERDRFLLLIKEFSNRYKILFDLYFDTETGTTFLYFEKDESLEENAEKEIIKNIRKSTFVFMTKIQYAEYQLLLEKYGDSAYIKDTIQIGTFVRKTNNQFTFKLYDQFIKLLDYNSIQNEDDIDNGYIKPIFMGELINVERMIRAMKKLISPRKNGYPVNSNLANFIFDPTTARLPEDDIEEEKRRILSNLNESRLKNQAKQLEAVAKAMIAKDFALIQGPPGTGKTTVIAEIIWQTLSRNQKAKILITSQTNLAVDNVLERLKGKKTVRPIRIGKLEKFEDEGKLYSIYRLNKWHEEEKKTDSDNAITEWMKNIKRECSTSKMYSDIIEKWKSHLDNPDNLMKDRFYQNYMDNINVFAATCSECGSGNFTDVYQQFILKDNNTYAEPEFDLVIIDEASKATPPELILPLTLGKKVIIIGDHKQLPPMIDENEFSEALEAIGSKELIKDWTKDDYKISQFEKLFTKAPEICVASLDTQFRMHKQIMNCISQFYSDQKELKNGLVCGIEDEMDINDWSLKGSRWHGLKLEPFINQDIHAIWVNIKGTENRVGTSYENIDEVEAIKLVLNALTKSSGFSDYYSHFTKEEDKEIGVITYYMPQMLKIKNALYPNLTRNEWRNFEHYKYNNQYNIPFRINTVDRFQGMERNIIIVSTVRSNLPVDADYKYNKHYPNSLGFAREVTRINVGFSRAKRLLIVIGNKDHFAQKPEYQKSIEMMHVVDVKQLMNL